MSILFAIFVPVSEKHRIIERTLVLQLYRPVLIEDKGRSSLELTDMLALSFFVACRIAEESFFI